MRKSIGFFVHKIDGSPLNTELFTVLNNSLNDNTIDNGVVFFNDVDRNPIEPKFAQFNSTDIWYYTGVLVTTTLHNCNLAKNAINKFKLYHLFNKEEKNLVGLLMQQDVNFITTSEEDSRELYRLTGKKPVLEADGVQGIINKLEELQ